MTLSAEGARPTTSEAPKPSELSISSSVSMLGKRQEAVCAGREVHMAYLERNNKDAAPLTPEQRQENAKKVADKLKSLGVKNGENDYTEEDVLGVGAIMEQLTGQDGPYAAILFQTSSREAATGITSAAIMTFVAHELASPAMKGKPQAEVLALIKGKLVDFYKKTNSTATTATSSHVTMALINKQGEVSTEMGSSHFSLVTIDAEGKKTEAVSGYQLKPGEKIVIAEKTRIDALDGKKPLREMMEGASRDHAVSGAETEKKPEGEAPAPVATPAETLTLKKVTYEDDKETPYKVEEYIQTPEYQQNKVWLGKVIEAIKTSTDPTIEGLKQKDGEDELVYTKRVVGALQKHLSAAGENENSPLSRLAAEAEDVSSGENPDRGGELTTLDAVAVLLEKAPELYDKQFASAETVGNPEEVKKAFSEAFELYEAEMKILQTTGSGLLTEQRETYARYKYTKAAYERAKENENWQLEVELRAHGEKPSHMISEGIPVEGVMTFLKSKIEAAKTAGNKEEAAKFQALYDTLDSNSRLYREIPLADRDEKNGAGTKFEKIDELMEARQQLEANQRYLDSLRSSTNPNDQERMQEDWKRGGQDLEVRRELVIPKGKKKVDNLGVVYEKTGNQREILNRIAGEITGSEPEPVEPAPVETDPNRPDSARPPAAPPPDPDTAVEMEASLALTTTDGYIKHNDNLTDHMMSKTETSGTHWYSRIPLLGGVIGSVFHPVQNIWRNGLAREAVREQNRRFVDRMGIIVKSHFVGSEGLDADAAKGQMRIPVEVSSELIDTSLEEGKKLLKEQNLLTRLWWGGRNALARVTTLGETSQMHFAKQWLEDRLVEDRAGKRDPAIERIYTHALDEQNAVGQRIAMNGLRRGERRVEVADSPLAAPVKGAIEAYFAEVQSAQTSAANDPEKRTRLLAEARTRLVAKVNMIGKNSTGEEVDLSQGIELASNVLSLVDDLAKPYKDSGKSKWLILKEQNKWNNFKINIIIGESRWGAEGGETPMSKLREKVLKRMAERELFVGDGERTHGVELAIRSITSDIATYGGAFLLGAGSSAALFGARTASKVVGGLGGVMGMSAAKEMGLRIGGHELFRGRYRGEVAQVSREAALGKKGPSTARIRGEMGQALVEPGMMEKADDVASRIEGLLTKDVKDMTEAEAYQILREVAQLDARMRIADISGTRDLQFTTQNYIIYDESQRNMQYLRLKSGVLAGVQKLTLYKQQHADFGQGEQISSGVQIEYGRAQGTLGMFEKFSALAEAQLRVGTRAEVFKWLQDTNGGLDNNAGLGMSRDEAKTLMDQYFSEARGTVRQEQSIKTKERTLRRLAAKRAATVVLQSALMMPIGGAIMGMEYQVLNGVAQEVQQALREGLPTWSSDWGAVITGHGTSSSPMSSFQEAVLTVRHTVENVAHVETLPAHDEVIDGVHVQLPGRYRYERVPDGQVGAGNDRIIDTVDGHVVKDLSGVGLQVDANGKLIEIDGMGRVVNADALSDFRASGISIHEGSTAVVGQTEVVLSPTGGSVDQIFDGHTMHVPAGTEWVKDTQGHNDLVVTGHHDVVLINDATISPDGLISGGQLHDGVTVDTITHTTPGESSQEIHVSGPDGILTQKHDTFDIHTQRQSMYGGNENNGMDYHRPIYDYKETNPTTGDAVYVIQAGRGDILYPAHNPFVTFNVPQEMAAHNLYFTISVPGHGDIAIPANYSAAHDGLNDALRLDPSDTHTFVTPQGHEFTYGEVAKMFVDQGNLQGHPDGILGTEYNNIWREILHLTASDSPHPGTITSSILGDNGKLYDFGVVRGGAPLHEVITTETPDVTTTESVIAVGGPIEIATEGTVPTFIIDPPANVINPIIIPLIPIPMGRENVEAVEGGSAQQENVRPPIQSGQMSTSASNEIEVSEEKKKSIAEEIDRKPYAGPSDMMQHFGLEQGKSFGKHESEKEKKASNERFITSQKAFVTYERARRTLQLAKDSEKPQKQREYDTARRELLNILRKREGKLIGITPFNESQLDELDAYLNEQRQQKINEQIEAVVAQKKDEEEKKKAKEQEAATAATSEEEGDETDQETTEEAGEGEEET